MHWTRATQHSICRFAKSNAFAKKKHYLLMISFALKFCLLNYKWHQFLLHFYSVMPLKQFFKFSKSTYQHLFNFDNARPLQAVFDLWLGSLGTQLVSRSCCYSSVLVHVWCIQFQTRPVIEDFIAVMCVFQVFLIRTPWPKWQHRHLPVRVLNLKENSFCKCFRLWLQSLCGHSVLEHLVTTTSDHHT